MRKNIVILRHGRKDGELIAADQIAEIENNGIPAVNELLKDQQVVIHNGSHYVRTKQTVQAFERFALRTGLFTVAGYLHGDERFGNVDLFNEFTANPEIKAEADRTSWFNAFEKADPIFIANVQSDMMAALWKMFSELKDGQTAITVGHTPMIEWLAFAIDRQGNIPRDTKLAELTGFIFTEEAGQIIIAGKVGF
jgi:phosphohistidine phosphatase SixA